MHFTQYKYDDLDLVIPIVPNKNLEWSLG